MIETPKKVRPGAMVAALVLYAVLVAWLTWPLVLEAPRELPATGRACRFDSALVTWALAHESRALTSAPDEFFEAGIYHPAPHGLLYGEAAFGALPYFLPPFEATGNPTLSINITFLASVILTAWALHYVVLSWTGSFGGAFIAAWTFLMTRWVLWTWVPCAPNYAVLQYFPLIILFASGPLRGLADVLRLSFLIVLQGLTSVYVAAAALAPLGLLGIGRLVARRPAWPGGRLLAAVGLAGFLLAAAYASYLLVSSANPEMSRQSIWHGLRQVSQLPWAVFERTRPTAVPMAALALIALGGASFLLGGRTDQRPHTRQAWTHATYWLVAGLVLSLEPGARWGEASVWLPQRLVALTTPLYEIIRLPYRLGIGALMGASLLAGLGFAEVAHRISRRTDVRRVAVPLLALCVTGAMYGEYARGWGAPPVPNLRPLPDEYPLRAMPDGSSPLIAAIRKIDGPLLELPIPAANRNLPSSPSQARAMYRSIFHERPILNGYSGYWPRGFLRRVALARRLPDPTALEALQVETGLTMILVRLPALSPPERDRWEKILIGDGDPRLELVHRDEAENALFLVVEPDSSAEPGFARTPAPTAQRRSLGNSSSSLP